MGRLVCYLLCCLVGILRSRSILSFAVESSRIFVSTPASRSLSYRVSDFMDPIRFVLRPDLTIDETLQIFLENDLSAAPVTDSDNNLLGIVTSFDFLEKEAFEGSLLPVGGTQEMIERYIEAAQKICGQQVVDIMSRNLCTVSTETPMRQAAVIMAEKKLHRLPVVDNDGRLVGMLTTSHIMRDLGHVMNRLPASGSGKGENSTFQL
jgi:CBS domain-containing protein